MSDPEFDPTNPASVDRLQGHLSPATPGEQARIDRESRGDPRVLSARLAVRMIPGMHDAIQDLKARGYRFLDGDIPGFELEQMRRYFGAGTGTYLCQADFQIAKVIGQKITDAAQVRMALALSFGDKELARMEKALLWYRRYDQLVADLRTLRYRLQAPLRAARAARSFLWGYLRPPGDFDYFFDIPGYQGDGSPGWRVRRVRAWINVKVFRRQP